MKTRGSNTAVPELLIVRTSPGDDPEEPKAIVTVLPVPDVEIAPVPTILRDPEASKVAEPEFSLKTRGSNTAVPELLIVRTSPGDDPEEPKAIVTVLPVPDVEIAPVPTILRDPEASKVAEPEFSLKRSGSNSAIPELLIIRTSPGDDPEEPKAIVTVLPVPDVEIARTDDIERSRGVEIAEPEFSLKTRGSNTAVPELLIVRTSPGDDPEEPKAIVTVLPVPDVEIAPVPHKDKGKGKEGKKRKRGVRGEGGRKGVDRVAPVPTILRDPEASKVAEPEFSLRREAQIQLFQNY